MLFAGRRGLASDGGVDERRVCGEHGQNVCSGTKDKDIKRMTATG
jgi:hypothetical protein